MNHPNTSAYFDAARHADEDLADALGHIRAELDAGRIGPLAACMERVTLFEAHLARIAALRAEHLGGAS